MLGRVSNCTLYIVHVSFCYTRFLPRISAGSRMNSNEQLRRSLAADRLVCFSIPREESRFPSFLLMGVPEIMMTD